MSPGAAAATLAAVEGAVEEASSGGRASFVNPGGGRPSGACFATIGTTDGPNDRASRLGGGRPRLKFGPPEPPDVARLGRPPRRPAQGGAAAGPRDVAAGDAPAPHPGHGWMGGAAVASPSAATLPALDPLIAAARAKARRAAACRPPGLEGRRC